MVFFVSFVCITLCIIAIFLSAAAHDKPYSYFSEGTISKPLKLSFISMLVLDIAVFLFGTIVGYKPVSASCGMFVLIQWLYIMPAIFVYKKFKTEGDQFDEVTMRRKLRGSAIGSSSINTMMMAFSLGIISFQVTFPVLVLVLCGTAIFFGGLEFLFLRFLEFRQGG